MTKQKTIERLCALTDFVAKIRFNHAIPADCFCGFNDSKHHTTDEAVIEYIERAVHDRVSADRVEPE
jgi:hypothetical protein